MDPLRSSSPVKPRCFFKIILSHITPHTTLTIPRKFIAYGYDLADKVFLKAPGSSVWVVDLERTTGEAILRNGWPEFASYYSICIGHVLLFKYEGNSQFRVTILDKSCTEIEYPMSTSHSEQANRSRGFQKRKERATTDDHVEIWEESRNCHPEKDTSSGRYSVPSIKGRKNSACTEARQKIKGADYSNSTCNLRMHLKSDLHSDGSRREGTEKPNTVIPSHANGTQRGRIKPVKVEVVDHDEPIPHFITAKGASETAIEEGKARALALAKAFKSDKPSFILKVYPSHVDRTKSGPHVTTAFKEAYKNWKKTEQVIFQIAKRTWLADCSWTSIGYRLGKGWYEFARDSALTVGDVCVFELVNSSQKLFKVIIYRATVKNENW